MESDMEFCDSEISENYSLVEEPIYENCSQNSPADYTLTDMEKFNNLLQIFHVAFTVIPFIFFVAISTIIVRKFFPNTTTKRIQVFTIEFLIIILPMILNLTIMNHWVEIFCVMFLLLILLIVWRKNCLELAQTRNYFEFGSRPYSVTFDRATVNILTVISILAVDFKLFPREFHKSRHFGTGLMDLGIGLFVFIMGTVSQPLKRLNELKKLIKIVVPILILGFTRTIVIHAIDYSQDSTEYGKHFNAFFTLGLTKLFGALITYTICYDIQLVSLGISILAIHESILLLGLYDFIFDDRLIRDKFFIANREGICSLPGFISIYLLSIYIGKMLRSEQIGFNYFEYMKKLKFITKITIITWILLIICNEMIGISRRVCNFGYAIWVISFSLTITVSFMFVFDLIVNILWPIMEETTAIEETGTKLQQNININKFGTSSNVLPKLLEAVNLNGLTFFVIGNILTGGVNIFLATEKRSDSESILILSVYMLICITIIVILYKFQLRIA